MFLRIICGGQGTFGIMGKYGGVTYGRASVIEKCPPQQCLLMSVITKIT